MSMSDAEISHIMASIDIIKQSIDELKSQFSKIDEKFDETAIALGRYDERIYNNKQSTKKIIEDHEKSVNIIHDKIRDSKKEAVEEAERRVKIWVFGAVGTGVIGTIAGLGSVISIFSKLH